MDYYMPRGPVLDDVDRIKKIDKEDMCDLQLRFPESCRDALRRARRLKIPRSIVSKSLTIHYGRPGRVLVIGMGGSAIGGEVLRGWLSDVLPIPLEVSRDYHLPAYADDKTLVLVVSYSGDTEETLNSFLEALDRGCMIVAVSSGGHLEKFCRKFKIPFIKLPAGIPPRTAVPYLFFPLVVVLEKMRIVRINQREIDETIAILRRVREEIRPERPSSRNVAKRLAMQVKDTIPVVYGFRHYGGVALRMKTQFNENSKVPAKCEVFPELDHNEIVGWEAPRKLTKGFSVILLRDRDEPPEIRARIDVTKKLALNKKVSKVLELYGRGNSKLAKMLSAMYIGDFASIYLALLYGVDPTPVDMIAKMKREIEKRVGTQQQIERRIRELM